MNTHQLQLIEILAPTYINQQALRLCHFSHLHTLLFIVLTTLSHLNNSKMIAPSFTTLLVALSAACLASATPLVKPVSNLVYSPEITSPKAGDSWTTGSTQTVTWDTADLPADVQHYVGKLELGHPSAGSEHLDIGTLLSSVGCPKNDRADLVVTV